MIEAVDIRPYALPLRRAWGSHRDTFTRRQGWLVRIRSDGLAGYGDCAPMPAAGTESCESALEALARMRGLAVGRPAHGLLAELDPLLAATPATRFAIECALLDLDSRQRGLPLRLLLEPDAGDRVAVNAMLGPLGSVSPAQVQSACGQGFGVLKIKLGLVSPDEECRRLLALAEWLPPGIGLRLDANGAWCLDAARRVITALDGLPIESLEEPLREPSSAHLAELQSMTPIPLARDESLAGLAVIDPAGLGVRRLVLKPAVLGGLERTFSLARRAIDAGVQVVVTSLVESAAGLWPTVQLAAAIGSPLPHGLATADWLAEDLGPAPHVHSGRIELPAAAGSGFFPYA